MKLTFAIPALNRLDDETLPPLQLSAFNQILRYGKLHKQAQTSSEFYSRHLWSGSLLAHAKAWLQLPPEQPAALASPLWQQMGMHQVSIIGGEHLRITPDEATRFCEELSAFYHEDHWRFFPIRPDLWLVTKPSDSRWHVAPALDIYGQIDAAAQAEGSDALEWLGKQTEIQMWLHNHPINHHRTAQNQPVINGLWLWQDLHGRQSADFTATNSPWAQFSQQPTIALPDDFNAYEGMMAAQTSTVSDGLIFLDDLSVTAQTGDIWAYKDILEDWEQRWFSPALQALTSGRLHRLTVTTDGDNGGTLSITPKSKWAFWKTEKPFKGIW